MKLQRALGINKFYGFQILEEGIAERYENKKDCINRFLEMEGGQVFEVSLKKGEWVSKEIYI